MSVVVDSVDGGGAVCLVSSCSRGNHLGLFLNGCDLAKKSHNTYNNFFQYEGYRGTHVQVHQKVDRNDQKWIAKAVLNRSQ